MNDYSKITALYSRLSVGDEDRDSGGSNSIQNQKKFLESYARQLKLTNIRHYIADDESGSFFERSAYSRMIEDEENRYKWNKVTLTHILTRQEYCGDLVNFKTTKHFRDKRNHYVDRSQWQITENVHAPVIDHTDFENVQRILENAPVKLEVPFPAGNE